MTDLIAKAEAALASLPSTNWRPCAANNGRCQCHMVNDGHATVAQAPDSEQAESEGGDGYPFDVAVAVQHFIAGSPGLIRELIDELKEVTS